MSRGPPQRLRAARYLGSAAHFPHVEGGFTGQLVVPAGQVRVLPVGLSLDRAVLAEPLSVALHAVRRAGDVRDKRVLVTGAGPIGCLVVAALRHAGAAEVDVSDLLSQPIKMAELVGATSTVRADRLDDPAWPDDVDMAVEASGAPAGLAACTGGFAAAVGSSCSGSCRLGRRGAGATSW